ncbi:MAG TPA: FtsX-like permease family protein [Pirellulales bacterium]|nr:FtsX-like permease family protein [Pirellulales bacterium]
MSLWRLILSSLWHHRRMNAAVALGVLAGTAVLTGALLVGDSVRGSLRRLTLDRLGVIDEALVSDRFFSAALVNELGAEPEFSADFAAAVPLVLLEGSVSQPDSGARASGVALLGCNRRFFTLDADRRGNAPGQGEVLVNQPLADELGVKPGDEVIVRLPRSSEIPPDSALGRKTETIANRRVRVREILPAAGLGRFALRPNQQQPMNAYLNLEELQTALDQPDRVNAILVAGHDVDTLPPAENEERLDRLLQPRLSDFGLSLVRNERGYFNLSSERMLLDPAIETAAMEAFKADRPQPALTYLANYILAGKDDRGKIPYSTVAALPLSDSAPLGPFMTPEGEPIVELGPNEILLNRWAVDDFAAQGVKLAPGDPIRLTYFEPESMHGKVLESTKTFKFKAVVSVQGPALDRDFTPELKGVTDQESLANWDPPFPYDAARVRSTPPNDQDEKYWDLYRATPKAFISLNTGRKLWGSRFGRTTTIRIPAPQDASRADLAAELRQALAPKQAELGFAFRPVKRQGLAASAGTTDFNQLFLGFSFFIIAAALMLVVLLFRLGAEQRAREIGILLAVGFKLRQVQGALLAEGFFVAALGALAGVAAGVGYAWLMLAGLRTPGWWLAAVSSPFLQLHVSSQSLLVGYASGVLVSLLAIAWPVWQMRKISVRRLLANQAGEEAAGVRRRASLSRFVGASSLAMAVAAGAAATRLQGEAQAGAFFGSGALVLTALLAFVWARFRMGDTGQLIRPGGGALVRLAVRNGARNPGRSTLTIGLVASASFLIIAISAFRLDPPESVRRRESGSGGFPLFAQSDLPIYRDLNGDEGREELDFSAADAKQLAGSEIISLRVKPGDDASCLNLYQPRQPRVLGVGAALVRRGGFEWGASAATTPAEQANPWLLLDKPAGASGDAADVVPVVMDANTATYSLHLGGIGATYEIPDGRGGQLTLEIVGLLKNSLFQGDLLIGEQAFLAHFPETSGYRYFLIDAPENQQAAVETALENTLGDFGFDVEPSARRLSDLMAVQNTYLSTFQSLGGLGLLLGTFGLAVVQLRNVLERRGELALLRAAGFRRSMLAEIVMLENAWLLVGGLAVGVLAALVAIAPHLAGGAATIPWRSLAATLGVVLGVGLAAGLMAVRAALSTPLLPALRGD